MTLPFRTEPRPAGPDAPHAVVVGAGFGGLAAAVRLRARVFEQEGFTFDAGPTVITVPFLFEGLLDDIFHNKTLADDVSLYLHHPTTTDPSMAPDGHDAFYVFSPVPHPESGTDWREQAEPYRQAVEQRPAETVLPGLGDPLVTSRLLIPQDFLDDYKSLTGAAFLPSGVAGS